MLIALSLSLQAMSQRKKLKERSRRPALETCKAECSRLNPEKRVEA